MILCVSGLLLQGQGTLEFEETVHDFGEISESDGSVQHTFSFVNSGDKPIKISRVKASCGCTTPGWTKEQILPGDSGYVKAKYNARNRPGRFRKSLKVTTNEASANKTLYISGYVKPKPKSPAEEYPVALDVFRLKKKSLNLGRITTEKAVEKHFDIYNESDAAQSLNPDAMQMPPHISVSLEPSSLESKKAGKLKILYDPNVKNDYGYVSDNIQLDSTDLSIVVVIEEYFPEMTEEELASAPKLEISNRTYDFGTIAKDATVTANFELTNLGKEKLEIRAIKSNCSCVTYEAKKQTLRKGKSTVLNVVFDTKDLKGNQYKTLTVYANDPKTPTQIITMRGKIAK